MRQLVLILLAGLAAPACTYNDYGYGYDGYSAPYRTAPYGSYAYQGALYQPGPYDGALGGSGGDELDPWLALTPEGREIVRLGFDEDHDGRITGETASAANIWFRRYADTDGDLRLTDEEIRTALAQGVRNRGWTPIAY